MMTCDFCDGEGWIYAEAEGCAWPCPECNGSGWVEGEPEPLDIEDLDLRAPIDSLLEAWRDLACLGEGPGTRRRIAGACDRRLTKDYRTAEC